MFFIIKNDFDLTEYPGVVCTNWDLIPKPSIEKIKSEISGSTVKFHTLDPEVSTIVASELEIAETEIVGLEKSSVDMAIAVRVTKPEINETVSYSVDYWVSR